MQGFGRFFCWPRWTDNLLIIFPLLCIALYKKVRRRAGCQPFRSRATCKTCGIYGKTWLNLDKQLHVKGSCGYDSSKSPGEKLDAAIIFAPVGNLVPKALSDVDKGGAVICGGIHMSDIPSFPYNILWGERLVRSVANLTRKDGEEFLKLAPQVPVKTQTQVFPLAQANEALQSLRNGKI